jgi:hypothetical protein
MVAVATVRNVDVDGGGCGWRRMWMEEDVDGGKRM